MRPKRIKMKLRCLMLFHHKLRNIITNQKWMLENIKYLTSIFPYLVSSVRRLWPPLRYLIGVEIKTKTAHTCKSKILKSNVYTRKMSEHAALWRPWTTIPRQLAFIANSSPIPAQTSPLRSDRMLYPKGTKGSSGLLVEKMHTRSGGWTERVHNGSMIKLSVSLWIENDWEKL